MSDLEQFQNTSQTSFECADDPPRDNCPIKTGELDIEINPSTGARMCTACLASLGFPVEMSDAFFDDDDDSADLDDDTEYGYIPEGDQIKDSSNEYKKMEYRKGVATERISKMTSYDLDFVIYATNDENMNAALLSIEKLEKNGEPLFLETTAVVPKVIAAISHMRGKGLPNQELFKPLNIDYATTYKLYSRLQLIDRPDINNSVSREIEILSKLVDIPSPISLQARESYERTRPISSVLSDKVKAASWLFLTAKASDAQVYKKDFYALPGVSRSAFNKSLSTYQAQGNAYIVEETSEDI
tara:strand:+ start:7485 stop:8384 length:900 start_codon:yes stop_codon:yes gene_type:complete